MAGQLQPGAGCRAAASVGTVSCGAAPPARGEMPVGAITDYCPLVRQFASAWDRLTCRSGRGPQLPLRHEIPVGHQVPHQGPRRAGIIVVNPVCPRHH